MINMRSLKKRFGLYKYHFSELEIAFLFKIIFYKEKTGNNREI